MKFTKMHGIGNDYVYVNCFQEQVDDPVELSKYVSDRHFGIGSDGLILIKPSDKADFMMDMYNLDGSRGMMCGNGIRCVGKYVYDHGMTDKDVIYVETLSGIKKLDLISESVDVLRAEDPQKYGYLNVNNNGRVVKYVTVNMEAPILEPEKVPVKLNDCANPRTVKEVFSEIAKRNDEELYLPEAMNPEEHVAFRMPIAINDTMYYGTCVSMGNPHCIVFVDNTDDFPIETVGPMFETSRHFPERVNTEFIEVIDRKHIKMRVWERGSGETLACGTGACAATVASVLNDKTDDEITVSLLGGDLFIHWDRECNMVFMTGPATTVFEGEI